MFGGGGRESRNVFKGPVQRVDVSHGCSQELFSDAHSEFLEDDRDGFLWYSQ